MKGQQRDCQRHRIDANVTASSDSSFVVDISARTGTGAGSTATTSGSAGSSLATFPIKSVQYCFWLHAGFRGSTTDAIVEAAGQASTQRTPHRLHRS